MTVQTQVDELVAEIRYKLFDLQKIVSFQNKKKLTRPDVDNILYLKQCGYTNRSLAEIYGVNKTTISRIVRGIYTNYK